jgi:hypothetical protein
VELKCGSGFCGERRLSLVQIDRVRVGVLPFFHLFPPIYTYINIQHYTYQQHAFSTLSFRRALLSLRRWSVSVLGLVKGVSLNSSINTRKGGLTDPQST